VQRKEIRVGLDCVKHQDMVSKYRNIYTTN